MSEERKLMAQGYPIEDAITLCNSTRRTGELNEFMNRNHKRTVRRCVCNGTHKCADCPDKKDVLVCTTA